MINQIIKDIFEVPLCLVSRRGWGKSTSVKTLLERIKESHPDTIVKVFDTSFSWWWVSPTKYRQLVTKDLILRDKVSNIGDCTYCLKLSKGDIRSFIASIIKADYEERLTVKIRYGDYAVKSLGLMLYVIEESNVVFDSNSLRKADNESETLNNFISIGRNLYMNCITICTRAKELSTSIRERSKLLIGKVLGESDLRMIKNIADSETADLCKSLLKYHFIYDRVTFRIPDTCTNKSTDYNPVRVHSKVSLVESIKLVLIGALALGIVALMMSPIFLFLFIF